MKKFLLMLGAASIAFAACNKTETVVSEEPAEIGFKAVTSVSTKTTLDPAITDATLPSKDWVIYASALNVQTQTSYFAETEFKTTSDAEPVGADAQYKPTPALYWPTGGAQLDILAIAAKAADKTTLDWKYTNSSKNVDGFSITDWDVYTNQIDLLYARKNGAAKEAATKLSFEHALALVEFQAKASHADKIKITKIEIDGLQNQGTMTFDNTRNAEEITWTFADPDADKDEIKSIADAYLGTDYAAQGKDLLVAPQAKKNITVTYTLSGNTLTYNFNSLRGSWEKGKKYIYQLNFDLGEIVFTEEVVAFADGGTVPLNI